MNIDRANPREPDRPDRPDRPDPSDRPDPPGETDQQRPDRSDAPEDDAFDPERFDHEDGNGARDRPEHYDGPKLYPNARDGEQTYPAERGFLGHMTWDNGLNKGDVIEREGHPGGEFASPEGTPREQKALRPDLEPQDPKRYEVVKEPPGSVREGIAASYYEPRDGGGVQYQFPGGLQKWIDDGYLKPLDDADDDADDDAKR